MIYFTLLSSRLEQSPDRAEQSARGGGKHSTEIEVNDDQENGASQTVGVVGGRQRELDEKIWFVI